MKSKTAVLSGKLYAGNPQVRFDEGDVASCPTTVGRSEGGTTGVRSRDVGKNSKHKTAFALVFDTWYGIVVLWLLLELGLELLSRVPGPDQVMLNVARYIGFVQIYSPVIILVSVVVSVVRGKHLRAAGQFLLAFLAFVLYVATCVVSSKTRTVIVDISTDKSWTESSARAEKMKKQLRKNRIDKMRNGKRVRRQQEGQR